MYSGDKENSEQQNNMVRKISIQYFSKIDIAIMFE